MTYPIRRLNPKDAEAFTVIRRFGLRAAPQSFGSSLEDDVTGDLDAVRRRLGHPIGATFGAFTPTGELVGVVGIHKPESKKELHKAGIWGMFVHPDHRRRGLARALITRALDYARTLDGVQLVQITVAHTAEAAQRLYIDVGFETWGTERGALMVDGVRVDEHHMSLWFMPHTA